MIQFNIYFGSIGKKLGVRYRFSKWCKNEKEALEVAESAASSLFYKNEGKYGIPKYQQILKDANYTGVDIETMYKDYIKYYMRWYVIPTYKDTIHSSKLM